MENLNHPKQKGKFKGPEINSSLEQNNKILTSKQLQKVRRASIRKFFDLVDRDRRGSIRKEDVWGGISNLGLESVLDLSEVEKMFEDVEKDS